MKTPIFLRAIAAAAAILCLAGIPAPADGITVDFEPPVYATGLVHLQSGWIASGSAGMGCAVYDVAVVSNTYGYPTFGAQSLRDSNARTSGCFGDQTYSKPVTDEAGEGGANNAAPSGLPVMSGGVRQSHFEAQWDFASTVPGAEQPGLSVVASPDRGDGARMSWIQMQDTPDGLQVNFFDYVDAAPFGTLGSPGDGCNTEDDFRFTEVATGLDRTVPHTIRLVMDFHDGPANDIVEVWVDGTLLHVGTSWEDYFHWCEGAGGPYDQGYGSNESRTVDCLLFRTGGAAVPAHLGKGFLIDNLSISSGAIRVPIDVRPRNTQNQINTNAKQLVPIAILARDGFDPLVLVDIASVDAHGAAPLATKFDHEDVNGDGFLDLVLYFRGREMTKPTAAECADPNATLTLTGATFSGSSFQGSDRVDWLGPDCP